MKLVSGLTAREVAALTAGGLIVSCQARIGEPLRNPQMMAAMAQAAAQGGARAIRADGGADIAAIKTKVALPVFGICKRRYADSSVFITPTIAEAREVAAAGADVVTIEATAGARPGGVSLARLLDQLRREHAGPLMADVSTAQEGLAAAGLGFDFVATTLSGYTPYSRQLAGPDLALVEELAAAGIPVIAEGRYATPEQARQALEAGAHAVVVGSMITRPGHITAYFVAGMAGSGSPGSAASEGGRGKAGETGIPRNSRS